MPTDTFPIASAGNDGCGYRTDTVWANISTGAYTDESDLPGNVIYVAKYRTAGGDYFNENLYLRWDTSSLPDDATVTSANLLLFITDIIETSDDFEYAADFYDFGGEPSVAGDWELTSSGDAITVIDPDSLTSGAVNTIALTGLSGISLNGFTGIRLAPNDSSSPTVNGDAWLEVAAFEHASQEPRLEVTYTVPSAGVPIAWVRG